MTDRELSPLIKHLPSPIVWAWSDMLFGGDNPFHQIHRMFKCFNVLLRFLGAVSVKEYARSSVRSADGDRKLLSMLCRPTIGCVYGIILDVARLMPLQHRFVPELAKLTDNKEYRTCVEMLIAEQNCFVHHAMPTSEQCRELSARLFPNLSGQMEMVSFLGKYELLFSVQAASKIQQQVRLLRGISPQEVPSCSLPPGATVCLRRGDKEIIDLYPLIISTPDHPDVIADSSVSFLIGFAKDRAEYLDYKADRHYRQFIEDPFQ